MIETRDIRVDYDDVIAVRDLSLTIGPGEICGLIGPNGAGKTSLIRVLATLHRPTYGTARIAGFDTLEETADARRAIGYMPDLAPVYGELRCREFLDLFAAAYHLPRRIRRARVAEVLERVSLTSKRDALARTLSRGMTQRLVLAKTLLHEPRVLLLDEPASGLDPIARISLRTLLRDLSAEGRTVLISSHILNELSEFCTSIGIMERGRLVVYGDIDAVIAQHAAAHARRFELRVSGAPGLESAAALLRTDPAVSDVTVNGTSCAFDLTGDDAAAAKLLGDLVRAGVAVAAFGPHRRGVEDVLLRVGTMEAS